METLHKELLPSKLSKVRTFLFWCLAIVWFCEMLFLGVPFFNRVWLEFWQVAPPDDSQLADASMITGAVGAPVKGAFFLMAVYGLLSKNPSTRTALFISMSLIPPLNVAFPFRYQGFVLGPTLVGSVLSMVLWVSFIVFKESYRQTEGMLKEKSNRSTVSGWRVYQLILFAVTSIVITALAFIYLFLQKTDLHLSFPCLPGVANSSQELPGMIYHSMASGTHLLGLAVGSWIATVNCQRNSSLRKAMTIANTAFFALFFIFPIRHLITSFGMECIMNLAMYGFALLFIAWVVYSAFSIRVSLEASSLVTNKNYKENNLEIKIRDFLNQKRIAVVGVSRHQKHHPVGNLIYRRLKNQGHEVFAVNPNMQNFEGDKCFPNVQSIQGGVDSVVIITRPGITDQVVKDCNEAGVRHVWMHQGMPRKATSVSQQAVEYCTKHDISVISGACPMMYGEHVDFGHTCMKWILKHTGGLPK